MCVKMALFCIEQTLTSVYQKKNVVSKAGQSGFAVMLILTAVHCKLYLSSVLVLSKCESGTEPSCISSYSILCFQLTWTEDPVLMDSCGGKMMVILP